MAPPIDRRPGFSRKAQYGIFATYLLAIAGVLGGILLVILSAVDPLGFSALRSAATELVAPATRSLNSMRHTSSQTGSTLSGYINAASQNAALKRELRHNRMALLKAKATEQENIRLKRLLGLVDKGERQVAVGRIMSATGSSSRRHATLSVGLDKGVRRGMPVRAPEGLVGRILETGPTTSRVLLLTDTDNVVPVRRISDGLPAFSTGRADGTVLIRPISAGENPFRRGDVLITSGNGGLYAPNIPVAVVIARNNDGAIARPLADPGKVAFVMVQSILEPTIAGPDAPKDAPANEGGTGD